MKPNKYAAMTDEQLAEIARCKNSRGNATAEALAAQRELYDRYHWAEVETRDMREQYFGED